MSTHRHIDKICPAVFMVMILVTILFMNGQNLEIETMAKTMGYEEKLFDTSTVHTIDIVMEDWEGFLSECENEEYVPCSVVIDNEIYKNVGIRAKGNTSLSSVSASGSERYSFKIEFDQYESGKNYYGLDKICLNNIIQDNTYMKDYLTYQLMSEFGVNAPLCSYAYITVNGEAWGLYLAVEAVEESFLTRNFGYDYGELYKPDSTSMGGGRGNGKNFEMEQMISPDEENESTDGQNPPDRENEFMNRQNPPEQGEGFRGEMTPPEWGDESRKGEAPGNDFRENMGNSDVKLQYIDDDPESYSNIFENAKTDITQADKERLIKSLKQLSDGEDLESTVNVEEVIRYFVVHNFVCNGDSYTGAMIHNYYLYEEDGQLSMIPWDYNLAFGGFESNDATDIVNSPIDTPVTGGSMDERPMIAWIFENEEYTELYHRYFEAFVSEYGTEGGLEEMINSVSEMIAPYVEQDPTKFCTYEEFQKGVAALGEFCTLRLESIAGQLEGTIPSTEEGQSEDDSALVDASGLVISDMGSMGKMGRMDKMGRMENMGGMERVK